MDVIIIQFLKMKLQAFSYSVITTLLLLSGCIAEDLSLCPHCGEKNLSLEFLYRDKQGADFFSGNIKKVEVFVFDENEQLVRTQTVEQTALADFAGASLRLQPGNYRVVCWGNAFEKTAYSGLSIGCLSNNTFVSYAGLNEHNYTDNGDPLYYAPSIHDTEQTACFVTVPKEGTAIRQIDFCSAHIKLELYIHGFEDETTDGTSLAPMVELQHVCARYDFNMQTSENHVAYQSITEYRIKEGKEYAAYDFYTPLFKEETPIILNIKKQSDQSIQTSIGLKEFIADNNIKIKPVGQMVIPILIEFKDGKIIISLATWGNNATKPVW